MSKCAICGQEYKRVQTLTEDGSHRGTIPEDAENYCLDVTYIGDNGHQAEMDIIFH